ncbi:MAG: hypothetical protein ABJC89_19530, partial [Acidobacteriota bacterium]
LYRSGESEYLIDGESVRLRDVQDLLMDAGLGIKAYAVIEQGKIGQILSARPTDRRQLIEEAAGVTKYKSRRRAAELKLEAAQQNLTRVDDIVFEVEKQRGALKRQAAKARRYRRLRDELRRWEKVQFAHRHRQLSEGIEGTRAALADARARETAAAAHVAEVESTLERLRLELTQADSETTAAREAAHASELETGRLQQQIAFDKQQVESLGAASADIETEVHALEARREPARVELEARRDAAARATSEREAAAETLRGEQAAYADVGRNIDGLEADVEAARSDVFAAVNAATALRHAMDRAAAARTRMVEQIAKLEAESHDLRVESERAAHDRATAEEAMQLARDAMETGRADRVAKDSQLAGGRAARDEHARELRSRERDLAGVIARLKSLEELEAARAEYGDGARLVLAESGGDVAQLGSVADYLEVDGEYERAVEACLGELLQYVVVETHEHATAGLQFARTHNAGRVGFLVASATEAPRLGASDPESRTPDPDLLAFDFGASESASPEPRWSDPGSRTPDPDLAPSHLTRLADVVRVSGPAADVIRAAISHAWIADAYESARDAAARTDAAVATRDGEVFRGAHVVEGGARAEARGILTTKREIKELRERAEADGAAVDRLREEIASVDVTIATLEAAILSLQGELHRQEKAVVGFDLQGSNARETSDRINRKQEQIATERRSAEEESRTQAAREEEARESIVRVDAEHRTADELLNAAQRRLFDAREAMQAQAQRTSEARASHAALVERASALAIEVQRLDESARDLESRLTGRQEDLRRTHARRSALLDAIATSEARLDSGLRAFDELRDRVRIADEASQALRAGFDEQERRIREARRSLELVRAEASQLEITRATAESDLSHLASSCLESVQASLDEIAAEVAQLERDGLLVSPKPVDDAPDAAEADGEAGASAAEAVPDAAPAAGAPLTPDEMAADLRAKIENMGAVNMMAIDQFDDLESRHAFLTTQRKDLVDSIAATGEAIRKIDKTTRERFREAFTIINQNFEQTFTTLFGGGRAGLILLDESDQLESGIEIIAQPPGKRLQSVQLLSGGEKALTAMGLMFAIFKYRPSPFCLLDEIDAPLDDANIGR